MRHDVEWLMARRIDATFGHGGPEENSNIETPLVAIYVLLGNAQASFTAGQLSEATRAYERILASASESLPCRIRASVLNNLGLIAVRRKNLASGLSFFTQALALLSGEGDSARRAEGMGNIGSVYRDQEQGASALQWYRQSLAVFELLADKRGSADQHTNIGYILAVEGEPADALTHYHVARDLYEELKEERKAASVHANIGVLESTLGHEPR